MNDSTDLGYGLLVELVKQLFSQERLHNKVNFISFVVLWLFTVVNGDALSYFHHTEILYKSFIFLKNQSFSKTVVLVQIIVKLIWSDGLTDTQTNLTLSSALNFHFIM
jgi:hypothetical protein